MKKKTISMHNWFVVRVPYIMLIVSFIFFGFSGAPTFPNDDVYQLTAFFVAGIQTLSIVFPKWTKMVLIADLITIFWLMMIAWEVYVHLYPQRAGLFAIMETPTVAIFLAFGSPLRSRIYSRKIVIKTPHYSENLTPHYSSPTRGRV